jgi:alpha-ketoglutarate-dependent taurine dioxygenase
MTWNRNTSVKPAGGQFDNHARAYDNITSTPLAAAMGSEIGGVDCTQASDAQIVEIQQALFHHKMIFFRDHGHMTHADHSAFSKRFGVFAEDAYSEGVPGFPEVQPVIKEADARTGWVFGSGWHTDSPFLPEPPAISTLRSVEIPPFGGDTIWANCALAYSTLSETMQKMLADLRVHMSIRDVLAGAQEHGSVKDGILGPLVAQKNKPVSEDMQKKINGAMHPLVRSHDVSGEKSLYCDGSYAVGIEGMKPEESAPLLQFLTSHITQPAFTCRLRWEAGMLVMWDNRLSVHQAFNDYDGYRREMYRTTIAGEKPQ